MNKGVMAKINLNNVTNPSQVSVMNDNFQKVAQALNDKVLYRDNVPGEPNQMESPLDMNGERLYNLPAPIADNEAARLQDVKDAVVGGAYNKALRVTDESVPALPNKVFRANKLLSFDADGKPTVQYPSEDSATQLRIDLGSPTGAEPVGGFASALSVRQYSGSATTAKIRSDGGLINKRAFKAGDVDDGVTRFIDADGSVWERPERGVVNVLWFGEGVGAGDPVKDTLALQSALDWIASLPETSTYPYITRKLRIPKMDVPYVINTSLHAPFTLNIEPSGAVIHASPGFIPKTIYGQVMNFMLVLKDGSPGQIRWGACIPQGLVLDCRDSANSAIYIERMPYSRIGCEVQSSVLDSIVIGPSMWGVNLDNIVIENFGKDAVAFLTDSAANGGSMNNPKIWGEFKEGNSGIRFDANAECNGFVISGGFIEKTLYGILRLPGGGLITVDGVDFEQCTYNVIRAAGTSTTSREKMFVRGSFLHSTNSGGSTVYTSGVDVIMEGCRFYNNDVFNVITETTGAVHLRNCIYPGGVLNAPAGATVVFNDDESSTSWKKSPVDTLVQTLHMQSLAYVNAPSTLSSNLSFAHAGGDTTLKNHGTAFLYVNSTNAGGANLVQTGVAVDSYTNSVRPTVDLVPSLGSASARWSQVYAGDATINTSDARDKQQVRPLNEAERAVAIRLKGLVRAFKWNSAVESKGSTARLHIGVLAQEVVHAFEEEGLNAEDYGLLCFDRWDATPEMQTRDGEVAEAPRPSGERYGIRYGELFAFIIAAL